MNEIISVSDTCQENKEDCCDSDMVLGEGVILTEAMEGLGGDVSFMNPPHGAHHEYLRVSFLWVFPFLALAHPSSSPTLPCDKIPSLLRIYYSL